MPVTVVCPACGKQLQSATQPPAGVLMKCPGCEAQFRYQPPTGGLPPSTTAAPPPPLPKRAEPKPSPARSAAQTKQRQAAPPALQPQSAPGGWTGFIVVSLLLFAIVGGGAFYFGKDYLPDFSGWLGRSKVEPEPDPEPDPSNPDNKEWGNLFNPDAPADDEKPKRVAANQGEEPKEAEWEPDRVRPKRFASAGSNDVLLDPKGGSAILDVEYSPDGRVLATFDVAGLATLWDVKSRRALDVTPEHWGGTAGSEHGRHVAFSKDGKTLVFGTQQHVSVIDLPEGRVRWKKWHTVQHGQLLVSPSAGTVVLMEPPTDSSRFEHHLVVYDVASGKSLFQIPAGSGFEAKLAISPDDKLLALPDGLHEKIRLFELPSGKELDGIKGVHARGMMFCGDSGTLLLPDTSKSQRQIWNLSNPDRPKLESQVATVDLRTNEYQLSPDGKTLVGPPQIWDVVSRKQRAKFPTGAQHCAFSPDSQRIAYWGVFGQHKVEVVIADASNGATLTVLDPGNEAELHPHKVSCVAMSPNGSEVAIGTQGGAVVLKSISGNTPTTGSAASTSAGGAPSELVSLQFAVPDNLQEYFKDANRDFANNVWISPDGRWLVTNGHYTTLWNLEQRKQHIVLTLNDGRGTHVNAPKPAFGGGFGKGSTTAMYCRGWLFHGDGKTLTAVGNNTPVTYDIVAGTHLIDSNAPRYESIRSSLDGRIAASWIERQDPPVVPGQARRQASETVWDLVILDGASGNTRKVVGTFRPQRTRPFRYDPYRTVAFSADGRRLAAAAFDEAAVQSGAPRVMVWDWESGTEIPINVEAAGLTQLEFIEGGKSLAALMENAGFNKTLVADIYDIETGSKQYDVRLSEGHTGRILAVAFDRRQPFIVTADEHGMVLLRDLKTGNPRTRFKAHEAAVTAIYLSSDGKQLATAAKDRIVKLWDVEKLLQSK